MFFCGKIRVDIKHTNSHQITICIRFPSNYPSEHLLIELKSRALSEKLLTGLITLAEQRAKEFLGKPQVRINFILPIKQIYPFMNVLFSFFIFYFALSFSVFDFNALKILHVLKFIDNYLRENPLCIVYDEIAAIKSLLRINNSENGELKCLQKSSSVYLTVKSHDYYYKAKFQIPSEYPIDCINWENYKSNFPVTLLRFLNGQAKEIARRCVERPFRMHEKEIFEPKPSLLVTLKFLIEATIDFPNELCPVCDEKCLPINPANVDSNDTSDNYVERIYCGHIYHQGCLKKFMREPPFPRNGKLCLAKKSLVGTLSDKCHSGNFVIKVSYFNIHHLKYIE